jgi:hypothetical protein
MLLRGVNPIVVQKRRMRLGCRTRLGYCAGLWGEWRCSIRGVGLMGRLGLMGLMGKGNLE